MARADHHESSPNPVLWLWVPDLRAPKGALVRDDNGVIPAADVIPRTDRARN
ncbi:hypothetical protein BF49_2786 [Bradyrhizobium sp.]|nr:hypothetical protein BF49_2786 [Bradyrhizobium sp.]